MVQVAKTANSAQALIPVHFTVRLGRAISAVSCGEPRIVPPASPARRRLPFSPSRPCGPAMAPASLTLLGVAPCGRS